MSLRDFALLVLICLTWAFSVVLTKLMIQHGAPPLLLAGARFSVVTLAALPWLARSLRGPDRLPPGRMALVGLLMGGGSFALMNLGLATSSPSAVAVVGQLGVPITTVLSVLMLGETIRWRRGLGIALAFVGAMVVIWRPEGLQTSPGLLFVLASAFTGSLGAILMKQMDGVRPLQFQAWVGLMAGAPLVAAALLVEPQAAERAIAAGWWFWLGALFLGLVVSMGAHTLYYGLIQRYEANLLAPLTLMTPLATIGFGVALTGDRLDARMLLGGAIALVGVLIIALRSNGEGAAVTPQAGRSG